MADQILSPREEDGDTWEVDPSELQLLEKVGTGCTAEVYRGVWKGQQVAIKQIDWNKSRMGLKEQRAFDREVAIMPRINHPNLVMMLGVASKQRPFRIVTEFCSGGCCFELLHNCDHIELSWLQKIKMCLDVAKAMEYLHSFDPQIIHRDLKSLNLLLSEPILSEEDIPVVKVSDFGLSRMKDRAPDADWGKMTMAAGTCHWMAPEVFTGTRYDEKVDVYSYAMILFEIICREIPFEEEEPAAVGRLTVQGSRPDMDAVPPDCPEDLRELMVQCWAHDPKKRPTFPEIVKRLEMVEPPVE